MLIDMVSVKDRGAVLEQRLLKVVRARGKRYNKWALSLSSSFFHVLIQSEKEKKTNMNELPNSLESFNSDGCNEIQQFSVVLKPMNLWMTTKTPTLLVGCL